jgi:mannosyltransferase OCH1-like enzyme
MKFNNIIPMGTEIPKVIHQTYPNDFMPEEIRKNIQVLKSLNPNWEYKLYSDDDVKEYISQYFPDILDNYISINPNYGAVRADLFRYLLIYNEGGVYLDIKSSFSIPLNDSLWPNDTYILSHWDWSGQFKNWGKHPEITNPKGEFQQCFIISAKGHPFLKAVIEKVVNNVNNYNYSEDGTGKMVVLRLTGPIAYTLAISPLLSMYKSRLVNSEKDLGYIYSIYETKKSHESQFKKHYSTLTEPIVF